MPDTQSPQAPAQPASASTVTHPSPQEDQNASDSEIRTADPATEYTVIRKASIASAAASGAAPWPVWLCAYTGTVSLSPPEPAMQPAFARNEPAHASARLVAVKTPASQHEIAVLRSLGHEGIVRFYDAFVDTHAGVPVLHLVMEPMEGSARQLLKARRGRPLAPALLADVARQLGGALAFVHAAGWAHRDLGAESVLVTTMGLANWSWSQSREVDVDVVAQVKLAGFAHACRAGASSDGAESQWQTPLQYRAPEGSSGSSQPAADVWALGALLAELTMLRPPFPVHASTREEEHWASVRDTVLPDDKAADKLALDFPGPNTLSPVSRDWADCIARLLRFDPSARISAAQVLELRALTRPYTKIMRPGPPKP